MEDAPIENECRALTTLERKRLKRVCRICKIEPKWGNAVTLNWDVITFLQRLLPMLRQYGVPVQKVLLVGGAASHVVCSEYRYTDLDFVLPIESVFSNTGEDRVFQSIQPAIFSLLQMQNSGFIDANTYIQKKFKLDEYSVTGRMDADLWSIFSFNNNKGRHVELKFVSRLKRKYIFSTDSMEIDITPVIWNENQELTRERDWALTRLTSSFGDLQMAERNLRGRIIDTKNPEAIKGGGFLKYVHMKTKHFVDGKTGEELVEMQKEMARAFLQQLYPFLDRRSTFEPVSHFILTHFHSGNLDAKLKFLEMLQELCHSEALAELHSQLVPPMDLIVIQEKTKINDAVKELRKPPTSENGESS